MNEQAIFILRRNFWWRNVKHWHTGNFSGDNFDVPFFGNHFAQSCKGCRAIYAELEQWEIVGQWQFPPSYFAEVLKVTPVDVAVLAVVDDNMAPTYEVGDRIIVDFELKKFTDDGVYIVQDQAQNLHLQRVNRDGQQLVLSNDNRDGSPKHAERTLEETDIEIIGRVCGVIAAR